MHSISRRDENADGLSSANSEQISQLVQSLSLYNFSCVLLVPRHGMVLWWPSFVRTDARKLRRGIQAKPLKCFFVVGCRFKLQSLGMFCQILNLFAACRQWQLTLRWEFCSGPTPGHQPPASELMSSTVGRMSVVWHHAPKFMFP